MDHAPHILLVNPWIHDFAAYDFWAKPMGLLLLGGLLRRHDVRISYVDCLDRFHQKSRLKDDKKRCGRGPYRKTPIAKPAGFADIPRTYSRYGIKPSWFLEDMNRIPRPDLILVTSLMTYWHTGVNETIRMIKSAFPDVPVVLGGVYTTLCEEHARRNSGADAVIPGSGVHMLFDLVDAFTGYTPAVTFDPDDPDTFPKPAFDLQTRIAYIPLMTSFGCPFNCAYCASRFLNPKLMRRSPENVCDEIMYWHRKHDVVDFVFYDDALLVNPDDHIVPLLESVIRSDIRVRFHTPNALHIAGITREIADLMAAAGFHTIRLGLETGSFGAGNLDAKVTQSEFLQAAFNLRSAGFRKDQVGAYLLAGLPGQSLKEIQDAVLLVKSQGLTPVLAYYTPIPHTALWEKAVASSRYDIESDPVFTNNSVFPCRKDSFSWDELRKLKKLCSA
ncbi:MAG: B12-binding domain-containing radical SAM protein [Desulfobacterales bacterium]